MKFDDFEFSISLSNILKFEKLNNISINVYGIDKSSNKKNEIVPLYLSKNKSNEPSYHLLMIEKY